MISNRKHLTTILFLGLVLFFLFECYDRFLTVSTARQPFSISHSTLSKILVATAKGMVTYNELNQKVFIPQGFELVTASIPIPQLKFINEPTCEEINVDWLKIAQSKSASEPPREIPLSLLPNYTLNGYALLTDNYRNDQAVPLPREWTEIPELLTQNPHNIMQTYGTSGMAVHHALKFVGVSGLHGAVIGSQTPWVEVLALKLGAKETDVIGADKVKYNDPISFAKEWKRYHEKFDFVVSFSSIEHSGLQRYGDPKDPIGDIREVLKVRCTLKYNGFLFLGLPRGQDQLVYNVHRIYGRIRLAIVFAGFELMHVFHSDNPDPVRRGVEHFDGNTASAGEFQDLYVLRKIASV